MRKHFLLLFLMALLPLAGWAVDVTDATFTLGSTTLEYVGRVTKPAITSATVGNTELTASDYSLKFYKADGVTEVANLINAGSYKVALWDGQHESTLKIDFTIEKVPMTISLKDAEKTYGEADPDATAYEYTVMSGFVGDDDKNSVVVTLDFTHASRTEGENVIKNGDEFGGYAYTGVTATADNYIVTVLNQPKLIIKPATLTVTHEVIVKNFGEANPVLNVADFTITGWTGAENEGTDSEKAAKRAAVYSFANPAYTQDNINANCDKNGVFFAGITAGYSCNVTDLTLNTNNYKLSFEGVTMKIKQIELKDDANLFTFTKANADKTYDGTVQTPDYTIVYKKNDFQYTLEDTDFEVTYTENSGVAKKAGDYTATVKAVAGGNFYATNFTKAAFDFTIAQRNLYVQAKSVSKVYNGEPFTLTGKTAANYEFNGIADADENYTLAVTTGSVEYVSTTLTDAQKKSVGSYDVKPVLTTWTLKDGNEDNWADNYKVVALSTGKYSITARPLTITAKNQEIEYGQPAPAFANNATFIHVEKSGGTKVDDTTPVAAGEGAISDGEVTEILAKLTIALDKEYPNAGEYENAIVVALAENQELPNYAPVFVKGTYNVKGATYTIIANNITKTYGEEYTLGYTNTGAAPAVAVTFEVYKAGVRVTGDHPTDAGTYDIKIVENAAYKPSADYSSIEYVPGKLKIEKKALTVTPQAVKLNIGASKTDLNNYGTVVYTGLVDGDKIQYELQFNITDPTDGVTVDTNNKLDGTAGDIKAKGVQIAFPTSNEELATATELGYANANYTINTTQQFGQITIIAADALILAQDDVNLKTKITVANDQTDKTITFASIPMKAKEWYAMVLPFATSPAELVGKLGTYVVVNRLSSSTMNDGVVTVNFSLEWDEIPAGVPFLIKPAAAKDWKDAADFSATVTENITDATTDYATFTGLYETGKSLKWGYELDGKTEDATLKYRWLANTTDARPNTDPVTYYENKWYNCKTNAHALTPMEAYLVLDATATGAHIFVEDFENGTTSIKSLNNDEVNGLKVVEGWYTLNGVKLQGAPTEKGVYINNGKKVVVK